MGNVKIPDKELKELRLIISHLWPGAGYGKLKEIVLEALDLWKRKHKVEKLLKKLKPSLGQMEE